MRVRRAYVDGANVIVGLGPGDAKGEAVIAADDYALLCELGLSTQWNLSKLGYVVAPCARAPGACVLVARVLLDLGKGESIVYKDRNRKNLLRSNLLVKRQGFAINRPRDYLVRGVACEIRND